MTLLLTKGRLGPIAGRFFVVFLWGLLTTISLFGFGQTFLYNLSVLFVYASLLTLAIVQQDTRCIKWRKISLLVVILCIAAYDISVLQCTSVLLMVLYLFNYSEFLIALSVVSVVPTINYILGLHCSLAFSPLVTFIVFQAVLFATIVYRNNRFLGKLCLAIYAITMMFWGFQKYHLDAVVDNSKAYAYQIGDAIGLITGQELSAEGALYFDNSNKCEIVNSGTIYLDHDSLTHFDGGNYQQTSPWSNNQLVAPEVFRVACMKDGVLIENLGSKLKNGMVIPILGQYKNWDFAILCGISNGQLIIGDADFSCNLLAPYQYNLIRRMAGVDTMYRCWIFVFVAISFALIFLRSEIVWVVALSGLLVMFEFAFPQSYCMHGVRYVGRKVLYPHTTLGYGFVRNMQKQGKNLLFTQDDAKYLVIGSGYSAEHRGEENVILEPNASVRIKGRVLVAGSIPLGLVGNIVDARSICGEREEIISNGQCVFDGVNIIATGSPGEVTIGGLR